MDDRVYEDIRQLLISRRTDAVMEIRKAEVMIEQVKRQLEILEELRTKSKITIQPAADGG